MELTFVKSEHSTLSIAVVDDRAIAATKHVAEINSTSATFYSGDGCIQVYFDNQLVVEVVKYDGYNPRVTRTVVVPKKE